MRTKLLFSILATTMLIATALQSAEIIPVWHTESGAGDIQDMELLPGGNELMLTTASGEIQIRDVLSGDTIRTYRDNSNLFMNGYFEFTPDSTRVVMANSGLLQLVQLDNFERIKYFAFGSDTIAKGFKSLVLDPIKPLAYVIVTGWEKNSGNNEMRSKVSVYNYETMELVKDLTDYQGYEFSSIAVSDDGKYLATLNNGKAYLKVWNLETMELIREVQLYDDKLPNNEWWCDSKDIQFSKLNSDVVYYSGIFPWSGVADTLPSPTNGVRKYTISINKNSMNIHEKTMSGKFILFDNKQRSLVYGNFTISIYNFTLKLQEFYNKPPQDIYVGGKTVISDDENYFIGFAGDKFCKFLYDRQTSIETVTEEEIIISPNPTNSFVNIEINCVEPLVSYQVNDINGVLLYQNTIEKNGVLNIDFLPYPSGVYFITLNCDYSKTYKIIKED